MKKHYSLVIFILIVAGLWFIRCEREKYILKDTDMSLQLVVLDTTGILNPQDSTRRTPIPGARVTLETIEYSRKYVFYTDSSGRVDITDILASKYEVSAEYRLEGVCNLLGAKFIEIFQPKPVADTILTHDQPISPLVINEVYSCGPVNNVFFFFDQFIELYNTSDSVQYLDGKIITRCLMNPDNDPYIEVWDYVMNTYVYQFPGTPGGTEYPIGPGEFIVIASDAYNYPDSAGIPGAVNLENADWEFYNQLGSDYDNPNVPNLININPNKPKEYLISLTNDGVLLADGTDYWQDGIYIDIPISTILDGVEYKSSYTTPKHLTRRVDSGVILGVSRYSGKSRERVSPGKDTNNSSRDFRVIDHPTPGYQWGTR